MLPETERTLTAWVPAVVYTALIFGVSSIPGSVTRAFPFKVFDKVAHLGEFAGLGLFLAIGLRQTLPRQRYGRTLLVVLVIGTIIGIGDELHQLTVPGRAVEFLDWVADTVGVVVGGGLAVLHYLRRGRRGAGPSPETAGEAPEARVIRR